MSLAPVPDDPSLDAGERPPPGELPPRPPPPRTWRDRLDDLAARGMPPASRILAALGGLAVAAVLAWRLLAPPAPPPEVAIPFTDTPASSSATGDPAAGATPGSPAATGDTTGADPSSASGPGGVPSSAGAGVAAGVPGSEVVIHVAGAVAAPGVQRLPAGARVVDAVDAAGGATPDADLGRINLAAVLADGQQVYVLRVGEAAPPLAAGSSGSPDGADAPGGLVNVNTANATELEDLPGVGPATAAAIIAHRDQHGPFGSVDELIDVRGIGEAKLEQLRDRATV